MAQQKIRVKRAFFFNGAPTKVGDVIEVTSVFARELIASKKAEAVTVEAQPAASSQEEKEKSTSSRKGKGDLLDA